MKHWPKVWPVFCESKELLIKTKTLTKKPRHRTRCLLRSKTKLRTEYSATEAILSLLCSKVFIVTSHLAQEAKCSQLFVTTLYPPPPPPPPPPPAADPLSKPSTELRALSTTFIFKQQWKCSVNFNWRQHCAPVYYERVEAGRLESCWFLPGSMPRLTPEVL